MLICLLKISKSVKTEFAAVAPLAERRRLKDGLTGNKGRSRRFRKRTRRLKMSMKDEQDLQPEKSLITKIGSICLFK